MRPARGILSSTFEEVLTWDRGETPSKITGDHPGDDSTRDGRDAR